jgi:Flp pilus assembly protein TadD
MRYRRVVLGLALALVLTPSVVSAASESDPAPKKDANYVAAEMAVKANDYRGAITLLEKVVKTNPKNAGAFNYLGYSYRKLGDFDRALGHYQQALKLDPDHRGAHEYLGELYLQMNDLVRAQQHLDRLDKICIFGCEEYTDLKEAIKAYKAKQSS